MHARRTHTNTHGTRNKEGVIGQPVKFIAAFVLSNCVLSIYFADRHPNPRKHKIEYKYKQLEHSRRALTTKALQPIFFSTPEKTLRFILITYYAILNINLRLEIYPIQIVPIFSLGFCLFVRALWAAGREG